MANEKNQGGIVYILTNPAMPGLVKIGKTSLDSVQQRLSQLYSTGVPVPFECAYAARVSYETDVEQILHKEFEPHRINPKREFFRIEPEQAKAILELSALEDVTPSVQEAVDVEDLDDGTWEPWTIHFNVGNNSQPIIACEPNQTFSRKRWKEMEGYTASPGSWNGAYLNCAACLDIYKETYE